MYYTFNKRFIIFETVFFLQITLNARNWNFKSLKSKMYLNKQIIYDKSIFNFYIQTFGLKKNK